MIVDLTHSIRIGMPTFPGDPEIDLRVHLRHDADHCQVSKWVLGSHAGTHMDAPSHFIPGAASLEEYPVDRFVRKGIVVDLTHLDPESPISGINLEASLELHNPGDFLVLHTGWDRYWGLPAYDQHPYLTLDGAQLLLQKGVSLVAIDAPDIEKAPEERYPVHHLLLGNDCLIVENLCNLKRIKERVGCFTFLPLKVEASDGSPIRAIYHPCP